MTSQIVDVFGSDTMIRTIPYAKLPDSLDIRILKIEPQIKDDVLISLKMQVKTKSEEPDVDYRPVRRSSRSLPPNGTLCEFIYRNEKHQGKIDNQQLVISGMGTFGSFSAASVAITNTSRNGWRDWQIKLPGKDRWMLADEWRMYFKNNTPGSRV